MKKKIIFRADGNKLTGLGHLYRIFALIETYKASYDYVLITREDSTLQAIPSGYNYKIIPATIPLENEPNWLAEIFPSHSYTLFVDGYQFTSKYQKAIKDLNYQLIYVDDLIKDHMYADIVINHSLSAMSSDYSAEPYTRFALGTQYAILRPQFIEAAKQKRVIKNIDAAFVCFGGSDQLNLTLKATKALLNIKEIEKINIVLGGAYLHKEIFELEKINSRVHVYQNLDEQQVIKVMLECNLGIVSSSTILYELCAVKMPVLSGYYVENQKSIYQSCLKNAVIFGGGNFENYETKDFEEKIMALISGNNYQAYIDAQAVLFDENIKTRFLDLLKEPIYRRAIADDMLLVFNWANDKLSRANSYFSEPILLETHKNWFEKKIKDPNCFIYIALVDNKPAGMVRYEVSAENAVVGILVSEDFRGRGLAPVFLLDTARLYFAEVNLPVLAYIKQTNAASVKSFEKANYKLLKEELVHGSSSFVYKLEMGDV